MPFSPSTRALLRKLIWPLIVAALIVVASSRPRLAGPQVAPFQDKIVHFSVYGLLATLTCRAGGGRRASVYALIAVSAFGATDEWHQSFVPGRSIEFADWVADTAGAAVAISLYCGWGWYRRLLETSIWPRGQRIEKVDTPA